MIFSIRKKKDLRQPPVFILAFFSAMFERFGFYLLSALLVLYLKSVFFLTDARAFILFGVFMGLVYVAPALGGYLADNIIGIRRGMILGLLLEGIGLSILAIPTASLLPVGLAFVVLGVGFFKTAPTDLMARSYEDKDPRIDSGFTLFYMSINIGSFCSTVLAGYLQFYFGWHFAFFVSSLSLYVGLIIYFLFRKRAKGLDVAVGNNPLAIKVFFFLLLGIVISTILIALLLKHVGIANTVFFIVAFLVCVYFLYQIVVSPKEDKAKIFACMVLIIMGFGFYVFYYQAYTSINLFVNRSVVKQIFGIEIPTMAFIALNPFWILALSPILAHLYNYFGKFGKDLAVTTKFPLGILGVSLCFLSLALSTLFANADAQVCSSWIVLAYFLYSLGELLIGALGVAMVTHIAPARMYGVMMGAWFLIAMGLSAMASGMLAGLASVPETLHNPIAILHIYASAFLKMGIVGLGFTLIAFIIGPYIKRIAHLK